MADKIKEIDLKKEETELKERYSSQLKTGDTYPGAVRGISALAGIAFSVFSFYNAAQLTNSNPYDTKPAVVQVQRDQQALQHLAAARDGLEGSLYRGFLPSTDARAVQSVRSSVKSLDDAVKTTEAEISNLKQSEDYQAYKNELNLREKRKNTAFYSGILAAVLFGISIFSKGLLERFYDRELRKTKEKITENYEKQQALKEH